MGFRDISLTLFIFLLLLYAISRPKIGIYLWTWIGYMNPHRLTYGFAYSMPFAEIIALVTFFSILITKEPKKLPINKITVLWLIYIVWMCITTIFAIYVPAATEGLIKTLKVQLFCLLTIVFISKRKRLEELIWITMFSIGFFGIKGGVFTLLTGGSYRVWGAPNSDIEDNNGLAVALLMVLPFFIYKAKFINRKIFKWALYACILLMFVSVIGSYSRGAFLAISAVIIFLWWKSDRKFLALFLIPVIPITIMLMPDKYTQRMNTIETYQEDSSAMGRIYSWQYAMNLASDRFTGGGFNNWSKPTFLIWGPLGGKENSHVAHSIYFHVIGDHGWLGFILYFSILVLTWLYVARILRRASKAGEKFRWIVDLCKALQLSYIAFGVGGAFLSLCYFDLGWNLIGMAIILGEIAKKEGLVLR